MNKFPKISIITPSLNQGQYIEQTILSVLEQNYPNLEYIIIDGASTDNTVEIIKKYSKHLSYWLSEKDLGQSDAINKGLTRSTGEIFNWLNSDDYYESNALIKVAEGFNNPEVNIVSGRGRIFKNENETIRYSPGTFVEKNNLPKSIAYARIDQPETFFRKSCIDKIGSLSPNLSYNMDRELFIKYLMIFGTANIKNIPDLLVSFRHHAASKTGLEVDKFKNERDQIFYSIAKQLSLEKEAEVLAQFIKPNHKYEFSIPKEADLKVLASAINYFLLLKGDEFYFFHNKKAAKICLEAINNLLLAASDNGILNKIMFRNNYLPKWFIKMMRRS